MNAAMMIRHSVRNARAAAARKASPLMWFLAVVAFLTACAANSRTPRPVQSLDPARLPFRADTVRTIDVAPGVLHHFIYSAAGPWAINVLEVERSACWSVRAVKSHRTAAGREPVSLLLEQLAERERVVAGVNADFFGLSTGVPVSAHVEAGRVITGPGERPVIAFDSSSAPFIGILHVTGTVEFRGARVRLDSWNRPWSRGLAVFDRAWGASSDTGSGRVAVLLAGPAPLHVVAVDTLPTPKSIPAGGMLLIAGRDAPEALRRALSTARIGEMVVVEKSLLPFHPREAVGGWPVILRDSVIETVVDSAGSTFAPVRHPRTAVGLADRATRLVLVVVDGRQKPYSDGMTLRELARLFQSLGVRDALNLDGGGSSTFVTAEREGDHALRVRNRPSDREGERPVSNALAIAQRCAE